MARNFKFYGFLGVAAFTLLLSCSTKKNTTVSRAFHNLTSYYNYYFNAYESYRKGIVEAEKSFGYNYTLPLPVLLIGQGNTAQLVTSDMSRTINKCTMLISKHSITVKPKRKEGRLTAKEKRFYNRNEYVRWAREAWLLVGKANCWKGNYDKARLAFEYVIRLFPDMDIWFEAKVWLARVEIASGNYLDARELLSAVQENRRRPRTNPFNHLLASTWADYYVRQQHYSEAIPYLLRALDNARYKADKIRYTYLLGQLYQHIERNSKASDYYKRVLKMNPPYDMAFSIKIKLIALSNFQGSSLKRELLKLASDAKNKEFLDQLYFTLAEIERKEGNMPKALEYYSLSAQLSVDNNNQKGMSYLTLADYYFQQAEYTRAQAYYDSASNSFDANFPGYDELEGKTQQLNRLVENLSLIKRKDSLLTVAAMPPKKRDALIASIIAKVRADEQKQRAEAQNDRMKSLMYQQSRQFRNQSSPRGGKWYFYNPASIAYGQSEFKMKWGRRKLEDNWRRKNKQVVMPEMATSEKQIGADGKPVKPLSNKTPEYYLANLPLSDTAKQEAIREIKDAMLRVAEIYLNSLNDTSEAIKAYLKIPTRFPHDPAAETAYFRLYRLELKRGNTAQAQRYKSILLNQYPGSSYAILLANPEYIKELMRKEAEGEKIYEQAYRLFSSGKTTEAVNRLQGAMLRVKDTPLEAKYILLQALCYAKLADLPRYKRLLNRVVDGFPNSPEAALAANMLEYLKRRELQLAGRSADDAHGGESSPSTTDDGALSKYKKSDGEHLFVALVPQKSNINQLRFNIISFNVDNFIDNDLTVKNQPFTDFIELIMVTGFKNRNSAEEYYKQLIRNEAVFAPVKQAERQLFIISIENFATFLNERSIPEYLKFFRSSYPLKN